MALLRPNPPGEPLERAAGGGVAGLRAWESAGVAAC